MSGTHTDEVSHSALPESVVSPSPTASASPRASTAQVANWTKVLSFDNRFLAPALITCILLVGQLTFGILESWSRTLLAIGICLICEVALGKFLVGKVPHLASAYISGISVGILVRSPFFWPYALCAVLTIASKYVLRWDKRHLWNPSNFGVSAMLMLYPAAVASLSIQWGNFLWPMLVVWGLGSIILYRLKRLHICVTYVAAFIILSAVRSFVTGHSFWASVAPLTGPLYQLYVFFMITDPRTTVSTTRGQCLVAVLVAVVEMLLRLAEVIDAPYFALFLVGPIANLMEIAWQYRQRRGPSSPVSG